MCDNFAVAIVDCDVAVGLDPHHGPAFARKAQALLGLGKKEEGMAMAERARLIDPKMKELKKLPKAVSTGMLGLPRMRKPSTTELSRTSTLKSRRLSGGANSSGDVVSASPAPHAAPLVVSHPENSAIFGVSLAVLMEKQRVVYPDLLVPELVPYLTKRLLECYGMFSEGIFRLSIASNELRDSLVRLDAGSRSLDSRDPNVYAVVLKHFFRHLPEPLCANFADCMAINADYAKHDTSASLRRRKDMGPLLMHFSESTVALFDKLWRDGMTEHARNLCIYLFKIFAVLTEPEHQKHTKMGVENLALVFFHGILRDPDPSPMSALVTQPSCQQFAVHLYRYVLLKHVPVSAIVLPPMVALPAQRLSGAADLSRHSGSHQQHQQLQHQQQHSAAAGAAPSPKLSGRSDSPASASGRSDSDDILPIAPLSAGRLRDRTHQSRLSLSRPLAMDDSDSDSSSASTPKVDRPVADSPPSGGRSLPWATWGAFFRAAGVAADDADRYEAAFAREDVDLSDVRDAFDPDNHEFLRATFGIKAGHLVKCHKVVKSLQRDMSPINNHL